MKGSKWKHVSESNHEDLVVAQVWKVFHSRVKWGRTYFNSQSGYVKLWLLCCQQRFDVEAWTLGFKKGIEIWN